MTSRTMLPRHFWTNLKGLSCSLLLLFGTFSLLILSVLVGLYTLYLSSLWPYLLVLSVCLVGLLSWMQLTAIRAEQRLEEQRAAPNIINTIPTITGLLTGRGAPVVPPPPYCEASLYQIKAAVSTNFENAEAGNVPPPSYDEAIKSAVTDTQRISDSATSRTNANPVQVA